MLILADWHGASTGFGTVTNNILPYIQAHYGKDLLIVMVAINYFGEEYTVGNLTVVSAKNYFVPEPQAAGEGQPMKVIEPDPFGRHSFLRILAIDEVGFDLCFIIQDLSIVSDLAVTMKEMKKYKQAQNKRNFKSLVYMPVDAKLTKAELYNIDFFDTIVTYNEFSRNEIVRNRPELLKKVKKIPHGNSSKDFFPMPEQEVAEFRKAYFGDNADKIIFANINRNQPRKAIGETILAFIEAKKEWALERQPFLYLHMMEKDPLMWGYDLKKIFAQTDLVENVDYMIAPQEFFTKSNGAPISLLRSIYNAVDICITTTTGEGWGLSVTEAFACRKPVILPLNTSLIEISNNGQRAYGMTNMVPFINEFDHVIREQTDIYECADTMKGAAKNLLSGIDKPIIDAAQRYVGTLTWKSVSDKFIAYFDELF